MQILSNVIKLHILAKQTIFHIFFVICRSCKYDDEIYPCHMIMPGNNSSGVILENAATASSHCVFWIQKQIHLLGLLSQESKFFLSSPSSSSTGCMQHKMRSKIWSCCNPRSYYKNKFLPPSIDSICHHYNAMQFL